MGGAVVLAAVGALISRRAASPGARRARLGAIALAAVAGFSAAARAQVGLPTAPVGQTPGAQKFQQLCAACHGSGGRGAEAPSLVDAVWTRGSDDASILRNIRTGFPPQMPAFGGVLSEPDAQAILAYLRERAGEEAKATLSPFAKPPSGPPQGIVHSFAHDFRVETIARLKSPYGLDFLPDGRLLVTETGGTLRIVENGRLLPQPVAGAPTGDAKNLPDFFKRGLLDLAVHPDARTNGWVYVVTARPATGGAGGKNAMVAQITRGRIRGDRWVDSQPILEMSIAQTAALRLTFDRRGYLYIGTPWSDHDYVGTAEASPSQDLSSPWGKVLRLHDDGRVPADNPFVGKAGAYPFILSYGHREPLGLAVDPRGELWESENGPRGGDELNHIRAGRNYGWPAISWGHRYDARPIAANTEAAGMEQPVVSWVPSPALSAITFYEGKAFPRWNDSLLVGSLKQRDLFRVVLDGDRAVLQETILHDVDRIRDVAVGPEGYVYLITDGGYLLRLVPAETRHATLRRSR